MKTDKNKLRESKLAWVVALVISFYAGSWALSEVIESQIIWLILPTLLVVIFGIAALLAITVHKIID